MQQTKLSIPIAIIIAGVIVAGAIYFTLSKKDAPETQSKIFKNTNIKPVTIDDHIQGNPDAPIKIVEFSDTECPFCKVFYSTTKKIMESFYGKDGKVSLIYRHFLLDFHKKSKKEAHATECAMELGGNEKFWQYLDKIYEITPSNDGLNLDELPKIATSIGLNKKDFEICQKSEKYNEKIENQMKDVEAIGIKGIPYSVIIFQKPITDSAVQTIYDKLMSIGASTNVITIALDKTRITFEGVLPIDIIQTIIDVGLSK